MFTVTTILSIFSNQIIRIGLSLMGLVSVLYLVLFLIMETKRNCSSKKESIMPNIEEEKIQIGALSVIGTRQYQQDRVLCDQYEMQDGIVRTAVLCDGMGGMSNGERASDYCAATYMSRICTDKPLWQTMYEYLTNLIVEMNNHVLAFTDENGLSIRSGTTLVACCVKNNEMYWAGVGDSRIYLMEHDKLTQITRDHNYGMKLDDLAKLGRISPEQAQTSPDRQALISYLGVQNMETMDVSETPVSIAPGSILMLCSDGITKLLSDAQIADILLENAEYSAPRIAQKLIDYATAKRVSAQDNTSVAIIKIQGREE